MSNSVKSLLINVALYIVPYIPPPHCHGNTSIEIIRSPQSDDNLQGWGGSFLATSRALITNLVSDFTYLYRFVLKSYFRAKIFILPNIFYLLLKTLFFICIVFDRITNDQLLAEAGSARLSEPIKCGEKKYFNLTSNSYRCFHPKG